MLVLLAALVAHAGPIDDRMAEIAPLRSQRIATGVPPTPADWYAALERNGSSVQRNSYPVDGEAARKALAVAVVGTSIDALWGAINDEVAHVSRSDLTHAEILAGSACVAPRTVLQVLDVPWPFDDRWWTVNLTENTAIAAASGGRVRELRWDSNVDASRVTTAAGRAAIEGTTPLRFTKGAWFLVAIDDTHTLVEYYVWTDVGGNVPADLASKFATTKLDETIKMMADLARSGQSRCK